jgi:Raf kinase inhibitor-like YbhB/YbcL family protein
VKRPAVAAVAIAFALAGCGGSASSSSSSSSRTASSTSPATAPVHLSPTLHLSSSVFHPGGPIPRQYTCDGADTQLPLTWSGVPKGTHELVLTMRDPSAPTPNFVHWAVAGIPASATGVPASGTVEGRNSFGSTGYRGPCPSAGKPHHYVITLSALSGPSGLNAGFATTAAPRSAALAIATLIGTYARP